MTAIRLRIANKNFLTKDPVDETKPEQVVEGLALFRQLMALNAKGPGI